MVQKSKWERLSRKTVETQPSFQHKSLCLFSNLPLIFLPFISRILLRTETKNNSFSILQNTM